MADVPPLMNVTPSPAPAGTSIFVGPTGVGEMEELFLHEVKLIRKKEISKK